MFVNQWFVLSFFPLLLLSFLFFLCFWLSNIYLLKLWRLFLGFTLMKMSL